MPGWAPLGWKLYIPTNTRGVANVRGSRGFENFKNLRSYTKPIGSFSSPRRASESKEEHKGLTSILVALCAEKGWEL